MEFQESGNNQSAKVSNHLNSSMSSLELGLEPLKSSVLIESVGCRVLKTNQKTKSASFMEPVGLKTLLSCSCFLHAKAVKSPSGACRILQMVNKQTLSASRRGSDPSQRPLTHLCTLPPIRPDRSILAIPEVPGHGDICVRCLSVFHSFVTGDENYLWLHS